MIKCNKHHVKVHGTAPVLLAELSMIVKALNEGLTEKDGFPPESAKQMILRASNVALMTEEEFEAERTAQKERIGNILNQLFEAALGKDEE